MENSRASEAVDAELLGIVLGGPRMVRCAAKFCKTAW